MLTEVIRPHAHAIKAAADAGDIIAKQVITNYRMWKASPDGFALQRADELLRRWVSDRDAKAAANSNLRAQPAHVDWKPRCGCGREAMFAVEHFPGRMQSGKWFCGPCYRRQA